MRIEVTKQGGVGGKPYIGTVNGVEFVNKLQFCRLVADMATPEDGCIEGIGAHHRGYHQAWFDGCGYAQHSLIRAWFEGLETPPKDLHGAHGECHRRGCVSPWHVTFKTAAANQQDKLRDGTHNGGERNGMAKITDVERDEIRRLHATSDWTLQALGDKFGLSRAHVHHIVKAPTWTVLPMTEETAVYVYRLAWSTELTMRQIAEHCKTTVWQVSSIKRGRSWSKQIANAVNTTQQQVCSIKYGYSWQPRKAVEA